MSSPVSSPLLKPSVFALSTKARERFENPPNAGRPASMDFRMGLCVSSERAFAIWVALGPDGRVDRSFFKAHASPRGVACASLAAELLIGASPSPDSAPSAQRLLDELELGANSLPEALSAAEAALRALKAARIAGNFNVENSLAIVR